MNTMEEYKWEYRNEVKGSGGVGLVREWKYRTPAGFRFCIHVTTDTAPRLQHLLDHHPITTTAATTSAPPQPTPKRTPSSASTSSTTNYSTTTSPTTYSSTHH